MNYYELQGFQKLFELFLRVLPAIHLHYSDRKVAYNATILR